MIMEYNGVYPLTIERWGSDLFISSIGYEKCPRYWKPVMRAIRRQATKDGLIAGAPSYENGAILHLYIYTRKDERRLKSLLTYMNGRRFNSIQWHVGRLN